MRGDGRLRKFPGSRYWHIVGSTDGRRWSESTGEEDYGRAERKLRKRLEKIREREAVPNEGRVRLRDLCSLLERDYRMRGHRSNPRYSWRHVEDFFGPEKRVTKISAEDLDRYFAYRVGLDYEDAEPADAPAADAGPKGKAARGTAKIELALLHRAYMLAVEKGKIGRGCVPVFPKVPPDPASVRQGFFTRAQVEELGEHLDEDLSDLVHFYFYAIQRDSVGKKVEWRHHDRAAHALRLPADLMKNKDGLVLPLDGELTAIIERRLAKRRLDCPYIFHRNGRPIGDFRKAWKTACKAIGLPDRIVHDLRRSGVKHLIDAGVDPHTVMAFSGHKTASMLRRYHIINLDDLRRAALRGSAYTGTASQAAVLPSARTPNGVRTG